ncbi:hypothetical protein BVRB_3g064290 [Beta vulgaris subsp. vulgaris]|nr:hypothetical protein BVRB_3g064290 [Beta vulgaris subsp. vulgaris]
MESKGNYKQKKLAAIFFLATVMLRSLSVNACTAEEQVCNPLAPDCCEGLSCLEVSPGNFVCEPPCEDHPGHSCEPGVRECCDNLVCVQVSPGVFQCA